MIEISRLTKRFGDLTAVDDLSISIAPGEIFGFIGPNGAGKSTTMKVLACLLKPDRGAACVDGLSVRTHGDAIRQRIGYMPDFIGYYDDLTVDEYLQFFASAFRLPRKQRRATIDGVLELTDLTDKRDAMVVSLSRGMSQRLGVARVLIHDPKVLLLDEPASGLDPRARIEMRELLSELARMGKTLMVSSHILSELAEMCSSIGIIERGRLVFAGSIDDAYARAKGADRIVITLEPDDDADGLVARVVASLSADQRVASATGEAGKPGTIVVELSPGEHGRHFLIERVVEGGGRVAALTPQGVNLEDAFLRLTKGSVQ